VVDEGANNSHTSVQQVHPAVNVSVATMHDGVFRRPLLAPSHFKPLSKVGTADAFKAQLDVSTEMLLLFSLEIIKYVAISKLSLLCRQTHS
jgi:hypothetical protein